MGHETFRRMSDIDEAVARFDKLWHTPERVTIEDVVAANPQFDLDVLLYELVLVELELRCDTFERVAVDEYIGRFPQNEAVVRRAFSSNDSVSMAHSHEDTSQVYSSDELEASTLPPDQVSGTEPTFAHARNPTTTSKAVRRIGDYDIIETIAQGGMGVVYKAKQRSVDRVVALKMIISGEEATRAEVDRFRTEAEAVAQLDHPNIVPVFDFAEHKGNHFLTMPYIAGGTLSSLVKDGPIAPRAAAQIVKQLADAMQYAHERRILHRDLKPGNVLIDLDEQPRITDFGLARREDADSHRTKDGQAMGTPSYMPPEQARGELDLIGAESDVYSLGAILYYLLTGRPPFQASSPAITIDQVLRDDVISPKTLNRSTPRDLETICLKCLEKPVERRYRTAGELSKELQRFVDDQPIVARPISAGERVLRWSRKKPWQAVAVGLVAMLLSGSGVTAVVVDQQRRHAELLRDKQEDAKHEAMEINTGHCLELAVLKGTRGDQDAVKRALEHVLPGFDTNYVKALTQTPWVEKRHGISGDWSYIDGDLHVDQQRAVTCDLSGMVVVFDWDRATVTKELASGMWHEASKGYVPFFVVPPDQRKHYVAARWLGDSDHVIGLSHDGKVVQWDTSEERPSLKDLADLKTLCTKLEIDADGNSMLVGTTTGDVILLDAKGGEIERSEGDDEASALQWFEEVGAWVVGRASGQIEVRGASDLRVIDTELINGRVWDLAQYERRLYAVGNETRLSRFVYHKKRERLVSDAQLIVDDSIKSDAFHACAVSLDGKHVYAAGNNKDIVVWNVSDDVWGVASSIYAVDDRLIGIDDMPVVERGFSALLVGKQSEVALLGHNATFTIYQHAPRNTTLTSELKTTVGTSAQLAYDAKVEQCLWALAETGTLRLVDTEKDALVAETKAHIGGAAEIVALSTGQVVTAGGDRSVRFWKLKKGKIVEARGAIKMDHKVISIAVSEEKKLLAAVDDQDGFTIMKLNGRFLFPRLPGTGARPHTGRVAFNADGSRVAALFAGQQTRTFETSRLKEARDKLQIAGNDGGFAIHWSPIDPDLLIGSDTLRRVDVQVYGERHARVGVKIDHDFRHIRTMTTDFCATSDKRRLVVLAGRWLHFLTSRHLVESFKTECSFHNTHSMAVASNNEELVVASVDGTLQRWQAPSPDEATIETQPVSGSTHELVPSSPNIKAHFVWKMSRNQQGTLGCLALVSPPEFDGDGTLRLIRYTDGKWTMTDIQDDSEVEWDAVDHHRPVLDWLPDGRAIVCYRKKYRQGQLYDGQCILAIEQLDGSWTFETLVAHGNMGHFPVVVQQADGSVDEVWHYSFGRRGLVRSRRSANDRTQWQTELLRSGHGSYLTAARSSCGHFAIYKIHRKNGERAPTQFFQLGRQNFEPRDWSVELTAHDIAMDVDDKPLVLGQRWGNSEVRHPFVVKRLEEAGWQDVGQFPHAGNLSVAEDGGIWITSLRGNSVLAVPIGQHDSRTRAYDMEVEGRLRETSGAVSADGREVVFVSSIQDDTNWSLVGGTMQLKDDDLRSKSPY